jgi:ABC-type multidrug transport system ATPase subunit
MELVIEQLSKRYAGGGVQALADVSLTIGPGMFGLLGPNGAGKSTLMRTLATLQEADAGSVRLDDVARPDGSAATIDVLKDKDAVRRVLGYLPQEFGFYPKVTAEEMLDHIARLKGIADGRARKHAVESLLARTNLSDAKRRALGTFSGGMKQRFGIAQALLGQPQLLIVDEPTAGLDPEERVRFHNLLAGIGHEAIVILSTHIVDDVADLCPRFAVISKGKVLLAGEPRASVGRIRGKIWRRAVAREDLADLQSKVAVISTRLHSGETVVHAYGEAAPAAGFEPVEPGLEDVYFSAVNGHLAAAA